MLNWASANRAWLFDGLATTLVATVIGVLARSRRGGGSGQSQRAGRGSQLIQVAGGIHLATGRTVGDERQVVAAVLDFLSDRRVLSAPLDREHPEHAVKSAIKIREKLTEFLAQLPAGSPARAPVVAIRQAAADFCTDADAYLRAGGNLFIGLPEALLYVDPETGERRTIETYDNSGVPDFEDSLRKFRRAAEGASKKLASLV